MSLEAKIFNKVPANWIQQDTKRIMHYDQVDLLQECKVVSKYENQPM